MRCASCSGPRRARRRRARRGRASPLRTATGVRRADPGASWHRASMCLGPASAVASTAHRAPASPRLWCSGVAGLLTSVDVQHGLKPSGERIRKMPDESCARPANHVETGFDLPCGPIGCDAPSTSSSARTATATVRETFGDHRFAREQYESTARSIELRRERRICSNPHLHWSVHRASGLVPADCGCGCGGAATDCACNKTRESKAAAQLLRDRRLGISLISQARRDSKPGASSTARPTANSSPSPMPLSRTFSRSSRFRRSPWCGRLAGLRCRCT